jgi:antitoxin PrlF
MKVNARGQVTLHGKVLQHLGIKPGDKIELDLLPDAKVLLKAAKPIGTIEGFVGLLAGRTKKWRHWKKSTWRPPTRGLVKHEER